MVSYSRVDSIIDSIVDSIILSRATLKGETFRSQARATLRRFWEEAREEGDEEGGMRGGKLSILHAGKRRDFTGGIWSACVNVSPRIGWLVKLLSRGASVPRIPPRSLAVQLVGHSPSGEVPPYALAQRSKGILHNDCRACPTQWKIRSRVWRCCSSALN